MMNSNSIPYVTQTFFNSSNKPPNSSQILFKFNTTHLNTSPISTPPRKITTKASAAASYAPAPENETLYDLLGISENGTLSEIKHAYKKMALKYHPDVSPLDKAEEYTVRFIRVQEAYETLSDPEARSMYDSCMAKGFAFSGKRETRFDPRSDDEKRWKEQISELQRRSTVRVGQARGMSWAARIRKQRSKSCDNGSDPAQ
ncbi:hypothetical protein L1987_77353 [Smallanthus sonchifolius]|uniref:Uncharacterized protein n=1 Tax=Smallanthus sonchifolius TaxID=185202 RepID=A0ACB8Z9Y0_9ASTR|nr:hypothetical protein L1987_77353 [Smallanthus sonchifolius]